MGGTALVSAQIFKLLAFETKLSSINCIPAAPVLKTTSASIKKLAFFVSFWYMGRATTQEEFQAVEELYDGQNETEEDVPEVEKYHFIYLS